MRNMTKIPHSKENSKSRVAYNQRFSTRDDFVFWRTCDSVWRHFWLSKLGGRGGAPGIWQVEARDTGKYLTVHGTTPPSKQRIIWSKMSIVLRQKNFTLH